MKYLAYSIKNKHISGIVSTLSEIGENISICSAKPPFLDLFFEQKPDIFIVDVSEIDDGLLLAVKKYPDTKLWLFGQYVSSKLLDLNKPDIFFPYFEIKKNPIPHVVPVLPSSNIVKLVGGKYNKELSSEILTIVDTNSNIDYLQRNVVPNKIHKIFGFTNKPLGCKNYMGRLLLDEVKDAIASTEMGLDIDGDMWPNFALYKKPCITTDKMCKVYPHFSSLKNIEQALSTKQDIEQAYNYVVQERNYINITKQIFTLLGDKDKSDKCQKLASLLIA